MLAKERLHNGKIAMQEIGASIPSAVQMCFKKITVLKHWQSRIAKISV